MTRDDLLGRGWLDPALIENLHASISAVRMDSDVIGLTEANAWIEWALEELGERDATNATHAA